MSPQSPAAAPPPLALRHPATASAADDTRKFDLDWLRIIAIGLLIAYHVGMYYVHWDWHLKSPQAGPAAEPWMRMLSPWRMDLLFLVSGAATAFMWRGTAAPAARLGERARRLLLPLLFGMAVIVPPQSWLEARQAHGYGGDYLAFLRLYFSGHPGFCRANGACLVLPTWNHLWYLPYLLAYTAALWLALRAWPRLLERLAALGSRALGGAGLLLWPVLWLALARQWLAPRFPVTHALVDDWLMHAQYGTMFLFGAVLARAPALARRAEAWRHAALALALASGVTLLLVDEGTALLLRRLLFCTIKWCAVLAALGYARRHLNLDHPARRYLGEAVFPVYLLHQSVIIVLAAALAPLGLAAVVEAPLLMVATLALSLAAHEGLRRVRWLRPLFGLKPLATTAATPNARYAG
ncbi:MAG: acyltransferase family protein [Burkholderiales bacterium]|nr:acyltransferase family protein [Burkholderiales bacterium]